MSPKRMVETITGEIMSVWIENFNRYVVVKMKMDEDNADDIAEAAEAADDAAAVERGWWKLSVDAAVDAAAKARERRSKLSMNAEVGEGRS